MSEGHCSSAVTAAQTSRLVTEALKHAFVVSAQKRCCVRSAGFAKICPDSLFLSDVDLQVSWLHLVWSWEQIYAARSPQQRHRSHVVWFAPKTKTLLPGSFFLSNFLCGSTCSSECVRAGNLSDSVFMDPHLPAEIKSPAENGQTCFNVLGFRL